MSVPVAAKYIEDFENLGFGMFIHWGLYSLIGKGEWIWEHTKEPVDEYRKLMNDFTAEDFDAVKIVRTAKDAGCKYITLTTRHHEGFSLYDTCGMNDYDAPHSACGRDLVREFVDACNEEGIVPFFYHTTLDWYNPDFKENFPRYQQYLRDSVEILCTRYGKIGGFWFDGNWSRPDEDWEESALYAVIRKHQPEAIIINNTGLGHLGETGHEERDAVTFEQGRPTPMNREGMKKYLAAEMCHTMNDHWGVGHMDFNQKSPKELIESLCDCRKVGANYLLNIGPTASGGIIPIQEATLGIMGDWMRVYGEAIYEGKPYSTASQGKNFVLKGKDSLYFFCYNLGREENANVVVDSNYAGWMTFAGIRDEIEELAWMDNGEILSFMQKEGALTANFTGFPYGMNTCVRVAKGKIRK